MEKGGGIAEILNRLKDQRPGEEFFLIWNGRRWCAGYMTTSGLDVEMNVSMEVFGKTAFRTLTKLSKRLGNDKHDYRSKIRRRGGRR